MTNHLKSCLKRTTPSASGLSETRSYHLVAEAPYSPYWLHLQPGLKFSYEYDFGSTTNLSFRVVAELPGLPKKRSFALFARNEPPLIPCGQCSKPATQVCAEHVYEDAGWLCDACAAEHECGEDMLMPIINSPRTGVCGYVGPSQEP